MPNDLHSAQFSSFPLVRIFLQTSLGSTTCRYSYHSSLYLSEYSISLGQCGIKYIIQISNNIITIALPAVLRSSRCLFLLGSDVTAASRCLLYLLLQIQYIVMQSEQKVYQIRGHQFPFGVFNLTKCDSRKIFVKKRYFFRNTEEHEQLMIKIDKLKSISHKNTINLRSIEERENTVDTIYQYVPLSLEESFAEDSSQTVKEMHRQFIELAIFLAKNCILTTFAPHRCGVLTNDDKNTLKYYLPLNEISITNNRNMLERSVQLFNVQAMHYLDTLVTHTQTSIINDNCSQRTFKNRTKLSVVKDRRDSQPSGMHQLCNRKFSNRPSTESQMRKLSSLSRQFSEITELHKRRGASTRISGESFNTFKSILSLKHHLGHQAENSAKPKLTSSQQTLKRCVSQNLIAPPKPHLTSLIERSKRALDNLHHLREKMSSYKGFIATIIKLKKQE